MPVQIRRDVVLQALQHFDIVGVDLLVAFRICPDKALIIEIELRLTLEVYLLRRPLLLSEKSAQIVLLQPSFRNHCFLFSPLHLLLFFLLLLLFLQLVLRQEHKALRFQPLPVSLPILLLVPDLIRSLLCQNPLLLKSVSRQNLKAIHKAVDWLRLHLLQ